jgi:transketolase
MTNEVLLAADILANMGTEICVVAMPWLNEIDLLWFKETVNVSVPVIIVENHFTNCGFGNWLLSHLLLNGINIEKKPSVLGLTDVPKCGRNAEVLKASGLDAQSLSTSISAIIKG